MTWTSAHLLLVGLPALGLPVGLVLVLVGQVRRRHGLRRAGLVVLLAASLLGLATFAAGQRAAREATAGVPSVDEGLVRRHSEGAQAARLALLVLALASAGVLLVRQDSGAHPWLVGGLVVFGLVAALLVARAVTYGGEIRHPGIRGRTSAARPATAP